MSTRAWKQSATCLRSIWSGRIHNQRRSPMISLSFSTSSINLMISPVWLVHCIEHNNVTIMYCNISLHFLGTRLIKDGAFLPFSRSDLKVFFICFTFVFASSHWILFYDEIFYKNYTIKILPNPWFFGKTIKTGLLGTERLCVPFKSSIIN